MRVHAWRWVLVAFVLACSERPSERPPGPVVSALVVLDAQFGADAETTTNAFAGLQDISRRVEQRHRRSRADIIADVGAVVFDELGFEREIDSRATRYFQLSSVIRNRRGSCLGLGALYLAIAERLGIPLDGILLPGHFFVRTRGLGARNIELLRRGEAMPDDWYRKKYGPWPEPDSAYFRPVSATELTAIHWYNRGNDLRENGDLAAAEAAFAKAAHAFPGFAEAHANLGAVQQLRGNFAAADWSYQQAARAWPDLPGLEDNRDLLPRQDGTGYGAPAGSTLRQK